MAYCLEAALEYCKRGFSVIPIDWKMNHPVGKGHNRKNPLVKWRTWQGRQADEQQIRMWWKIWPEAGVGIITGESSGILVMDADTYKGGTTDGMPPTGMISNTGGGGQHFIYKMIPGARNNTSKVTHIDVRAEGGYMVAPPSLHESGEAYAWDPDEEPGEIDIETMERLSPRSKEAKTNAPTLTNGTAQPSGALSGTRETWLGDTQAYGLAEGSRNEGLTSLAGYYAGKGIVYDGVLQICLDANAKSNPPLEYDEVARTVRSICGREDRKQAEATKAAIKSGDIEAPVNPEDDEDLELIGFDDYALKHGGREVEWLIPGFLTDCTIGFLFGPPGSYKSWGELDLAVSIAEGTPFLGVAKPQRTGPVILFQQEDSHITTSERIATIWAGRVGLKKPKLEDGIFTWSCHEKRSSIHLYEKRSFHFENPNAMAKIERILIKYKPVAFFMDPFYSMVSTENNMETASKYLIELKKLRDKYSCTFMIVHHTSKASRGTGARDGLHGSQFLNAANESSLEFSNINGKPSSVVIQPRSKDGGPKSAIRVDYDIFDGSVEDPGEWRFNTSVTELDETQKHALIDRDRKVDEEDEQPSSSSVVKQISPDQERREEAVFAMLLNADINPTSLLKAPDEFQAAFEKLYNDRRIRLSDDGKRYHKVLTLRVAGAI